MRYSEKYQTFWTGIIAAVIALLALVPSAPAKERKGAETQVIDFEDELIEGLNKSPLDSLSQISEQEGKKNRIHLYKKRVGFKSETRESLRELRYFQE